MQGRGLGKCTFEKARLARRKLTLESGVSRERKRNRRRVDDREAEVAPLQLARSRIVDSSGWMAVVPHRGKE